MVLIGVFTNSIIWWLITIMSKFDMQSDFIAAWFAGNIWGDEWPFVIAFYRGC